MVYSVARLQDSVARHTVGAGISIILLCVTNIERDREREKEREKFTRTET